MSMEKLNGDPPRVYKVVLFGVTGCGKSSIINLLTEKAVAEVSTGVETCTMRARWYPFSIEERQYQLWDTMGFNQAETKDINLFSPYEQAHALLQNLQDGVDLILLCSRKDTISASLRNLYWLLNDFFFDGRVQIALVLTHCDTPDLGWWERNCHNIAQRSAIPTHTLPHVCVTTVQGGETQADSMYAQSKQALQSLIHEHATNPIPLRPNLSSQSPADLSVRCQLSLLDATTLLQRFRSTKRASHVIIFGEAGAGKSSVINLISGRQLADVSQDINSCTMSFARYEINTGSHQFVIWDTMGLNGMHLGHDVAADALENAANLVRKLHEEGGVDLLVFCKKAGRITETELHCYRLYQEFLCEQQVPVALIITHLESQKISMDEWWQRNGSSLIKDYNLNVIGHACITSLSESDPDNQRIYGAKISQSRQLVQTLLEDSISISHGNAFARDEGTWVMGFLRKVVGMVKAGNVLKRDRINWKHLRDRCGLSKEQAEELVKMMYK